MKILPFFLIFILSSCGREKKTISQVSSDITKTVLTSSKGGKKTWRLISERIRIKDNKTYLYNLKLELFKDGSVECTIVGDSGIITGDKIALSGNITASTKEGATLTTSSLLFDENSNSISTNDTISLIKNGLILKGSGFVADRSLSNARIKKGVKVVFRAEKKQETRARGR